MKSVLFCRVSSKDQEDGGYSLPAQEKLLKEYAEGKGFKVIKVFAISESASGTKQREVFTEMLTYLKKYGINVLLVEKVDRLTRSLRSAVDINEWINTDPERQVHFVKEGVILNKDSRSNEKFIWNIKVSVAQYYTDNLSEEVRKGQGEKLAQGWPPFQARFGYSANGEKKHKVWVINEIEAYWVKRMFNLVASGEYSLKRLETLFYNEGLRTRSGQRVGKSNINRYLTDEVYTGRIPWCGKVYDGNQEPLVSRDLFNKVQAQLRRKDASKYRKHDYLFRGTSYCGGCGKIVTWEIRKGNIYEYCKRYGTCSERKGAREDNT